MTKDAEQARDARIARLLRVYGADVSRWPSTEGLGMPQLDAAQRAIREDERRLDAAIESEETPAPSAALRKRIMQIPADHSHGARAWGWIFPNLWRPAGVALGALLLGLFLGHATATSSAQTNVQAELDSNTAQLLSDLMLGPTTGSTGSTQ